MSELKPLVWHASELSNWNEDWHTTTPIIYTVRCADENGWKWGFFGGHGYCASPEEAKAAAQADYERRILSALVPRPVSRNEVLEEPDGCLNVGDQVSKVKGYNFPGEVRAVFKTKAGLVRYVIEATGEEYAGMLHIFSPDQIARALKTGEAK